MSDDWVLDVPNEYETRYLLCCEHLKPVPDRSETCSLDCCKAYSEVLKGIVDYGLKYEVNQKINLEGYVDSDWVGSAIDRKRNSGCCFIMGSGLGETPQK